MNNLGVPKALLDYFYNLKIDVPSCPICKNKMKYLEHEFTSYNDEIGTIRKFKCTNCVEKNVLLWRR